MNNRRGLSTVVGAVFFVIIFTTAISFVTYDMNLLNNFTNAFVTKSQTDADANHEQFSISKVTINNNKFNITVQNTGNIPITIDRLWVQNKTDITWGTSKYVINQMVYPGNSLYNIGQSLPLYAKSTQGYDLKLVTMRGNVKEFFVNSVSQQPVFLQLFALPNSSPNNFNTTLLLGVTNNMTNGGTLSNIVPNMVVTNVTGIGKATLVSGPNPASYPLLNNGDVAFFRWDYTITGSSGYKVNFKTSLQNGYLYNNASQNVFITTASSTIPQINFTTGQLSGNGTGTPSPTLVMDGVYATLTPQGTGRVEATVSGFFKNNVLNNGCLLQVRESTANMGSNGATVTGNLLGNTIKGNSTSLGNWVPFSRTVDVTGLTIGTKVFFDISFERTTGGTCVIQNVNWMLREI